MKHTKYLLLLAIVLLGTKSLHAAEYHDSDSISIGSLAMKALCKTMPSIQSNPIVQKKAKIDVAENTGKTKQVDSIMHYEGVDPVSKTCYTYYENGDVESIKEYRWDRYERKYEGISVTYYGKGGSSQPEYTIQGSFDTDGKEVMETRYVYDWTYYNDVINFSAFDESTWQLDFSNVKWNHITRVEQYDNGEWKTIRACKPQIKDSYLQSLTFFDTDANGNLVQEDSIAYEYNEARQLVGYSNYSDKEDGSGTYVLKYDDEGNIVWYGPSDESWYISYEKGEDYETYTTYKVQNGEKQVVTSSKIDVATNTIFDLKKNLTWYRCTESEYSDGKLLGETVAMLTAVEDSIYMATYDLDSLQNISNGKSIKMTMSDNGETIFADIYYLTEENNLMFSCTYRLRSVWMDDYTMYEVLYDENDMAYEWDKTCYHNPKATGISVIGLNSNQYGKEIMYDLMGRLANSKKGIRIINGKKILFK